MPESGDSLVQPVAFQTHAVRLGVLPKSEPNTSESAPAWRLPTPPPRHASILIPQRRLCHGVLAAHQQPLSAACDVRHVPGGGDSSCSPEPAAAGGAALSVLDPRQGTAIWRLDRFTGSENSSARDWLVRYWSGERHRAV